MSSQDDGDWHEVGIFAKSDMARHFYGKSMGETRDSNIIRPTVAYEYLAIVCIFGGAANFNSKIIFV